jgi:hypothetical protein
MLARFTGSRRDLSQTAALHLYIRRLFLGQLRDYLTLLSIKIASYTCKGKFYISTV